MQRLGEVCIIIHQFWGDLLQQDLRQGGVGDCWFMSARCSALTLVHGSSGLLLEALAVVAERPDLVLRLFGDTARTRDREVDKRFRPSRRGRPGATPSEVQDRFYMAGIKQAAIK